MNPFNITDYQKLASSPSTPSSTPIFIYWKAIFKWNIAFLGCKHKGFLLSVSLSWLLWNVCARVTFQRRRWHPTTVLLPGKSHGRRSMEGCGPWGCWGLDTTEPLHFHLSLSCIGEGNGNPLQCSCLENPRDGGAWWAAVYGVAQSQTRLKQLSSRVTFVFGLFLTILFCYKNYFLSACYVPTRSFM